VAIARAVVNKPAILLADEPTGNLDPATSAGIMSLLSTINANGTTVLMATHDAGIVDKMKRRVIELIGGQIVRDERQGGYQTTSVPIQKQAKPEPSFDELATASEPEQELEQEPEFDGSPESVPVTVAVAPPTSTTPITSTGTVIPEPGSGPPPGFQWPAAPPEGER
ncbi:MAG TPA: cell division ATP-binding protein FtsE, partial [Pseudolysinimonas sp.]|nr:cell division ATP-binding protein FtsE [Pseudolysinimonas sp.]